MIRHDDLKIKQLKKLRLQGYSVNRIMKELELPKSTVWHHTQKIKLSESQKILLRSNQGGSKIRRERNEQTALLRAREFLSGSHRESILILGMLYWAEGHKKGSCEFTNTDPKMVSVYLKILRVVLKIPSSSICITLRIFSRMDKKKCLSFWSEITKIPMPLIKVRLNDGGSSGKSKYGICRVTIKKSQGELKLMHALITEVSKEVLDKTPL